MFEIFIKCRHPGGESSLPAILKTSLARMYSLIPAPQPEVDEQIPLKDEPSARDWARHLGTGRIP